MQLSVPTAAFTSGTYCPTGEDGASGNGQVGVEESLLYGVSGPPACFCCALRQAS